jgi:hypothetical protein
MDCLRLDLVLLADGSRIFLEPGSHSANNYWGGGAPVIFASVRNASERERKPHQPLVDTHPVRTERNVQTLQMRACSRKLMRRESSNRISCFVI